MLRNQSRFLCIFAFVFSPAAVFAQGRSTAPPRAADRNDVYAFTDELLNGEGLNANVTDLRVRVRTVRAMLIRPRVSFVPALVKSVETLP